MNERTRFERELEFLLHEAKSQPVTQRAGNKWLELFHDAKRSPADFLIDGEEYFESVIRAMETAQDRSHYIYILGWMLDIYFQLVKSDKNKNLFKLLYERAARGVEIRILVWDNLIPKYAQLHKLALEQLSHFPNIKIFLDEHTFFPLASKQQIRKIAPAVIGAIQKYGHLLMHPGARFGKNAEVPGSYVLYRLLQLLNQQTIGAHHEKVVIVKGREGLIAFCGGIDFNENRVLSEVAEKKAMRFPYYHDNACRLRGPAAYDVLQRFKRRWNNHPVAKKIRLLGANETKPKEAVAPYPYVKVVGTYNSPDGKEKDRSLRKAYLKIIENAEKYIYIEDQYLVNLDVAKVLNTKIKESNFENLIIAIQDSCETEDILIPNRKRGEFIDAVYAGATNAQQKKVLVALLDRSGWDKEFYHPGMHAKTLIVDDEIAIIGSANVNQRSFTCDSETSVIVFDDASGTDKQVDQNFARRFRIRTWKSFLRKPTDKFFYEFWWTYSTAISQGNKTLSQLVKYEKDGQPDMDEKIKDEIKASGPVGVIVASHLTGKNLQKTSVVLNPQFITSIFNTLWDHFIDPVCH
jgi:phosphatidylserine/phosphatidylglycerophosphate/cardiolipin synthase-like enzyme